MKIIIAFFVCCLAVAFAQSSQDKGRKRELAVEECRKDLKLSDEEAKDPSRLGYYKSGCFYACVQKKLGYLTANGALNTENIVLGSHNPNSDEVRGSIIGCGIGTKGEPCMLAYCLETSKMIIKQ